MNQIAAALCLLLCLSIVDNSVAILCHRCTSAQPGCGLTDFNWKGLGFLGVVCPHEDDICVKIIERKGATEMVTRDCLSTIRATGRTDIPADPYEGCRGAALDPHLGNYVNNSIKEYDLYRNHYDSTTFCFCFFDYRCNSATQKFTVYSVLMALGGSLLAVVLPRH